MRDYAGENYSREIVAAGVLGVTNTGTTAVDMETCRNAVVNISIVVTTDVPTGITIQDSSDNSTFATHTTITASDLAATAFKSYNLANIKRYVRIAWTRAAANADTYWCVIINGDRALRGPIS